MTAGIVVNIIVAFVIDALLTFIPFIGYNDIEESALEPQVFNPAEATVYTISGQRVNAKALKPGVYIAIMKQGKQTIAKKIIIQ